MGALGKAPAQMPAVPAFEHRDLSALQSDTLLPSPHTWYGSFLCMQNYSLDDRGRNLVFFCEG